MSAKVYRAGLGIHELMGELRRLLRMHGRADRLICRYLADLADGRAELSSLVMDYGGVVELVRARLRLTRKSIRERIRVGRALRVLPALDAALRSGRLTYSRVREVTRVATPADESLWLEAAQDLSMRALERQVSRARDRPRSRRRGPVPQHPEPMPMRDNAGEVSLSLPADVWALVEHAMRVVRAALGQNLTDAEALAAVARSALAHHNATVLNGAAPLGVQVTDPTCPTPDVPRDSDSETASREATHSGSGQAGTAGDGWEAPHGGTAESEEAAQTATAARRRETPHHGIEASETAGPGREARHHGIEAGEAAGAGPATTHGGTGDGELVEGELVEGELVEGELVEGEGRAAAPAGCTEAETGDGKAIQLTVEQVSPDERRLLDVLASGRSLTLGTLCDFSRLSPSRAACALYELLHAGRVTRDSIGLCDVYRLRKGGAEFRRAG